MRQKQTTRQRKRSKWQSSTTRWRSVGHEEALGDVIITRAARKPPSYMLEKSDDQGRLIKCVLRKEPKGKRGYILMLPQGGIHVFPTRRKAIDFFGRLVVLEEKPVDVPHVVAS